MLENYIKHCHFHKKNNKVQQTKTIATNNARSWRCVRSPPCFHWWIWSRDSNSDCSLDRALLQAAKRHRVHDSVFLCLQNNVLQDVCADLVSMFIGNSNLLQIMKTVKWKIISDWTKCAQNEVIDMWPLEINSWLHLQIMQNVKERHRRQYRF
jgi:hypothetical protein